MRAPVIRIVAAVAIPLGAVAAAASGQEIAIYEDALQNGFQDWSWATVDLGFSGETHAGTSAIRLEPDGWAALYLHRDASYDFADLTELRFWVRSESGTPSVRVVLLSGGGEVVDVPLADVVSGGVSSTTWREAVIDLSSLSPSGPSFNELWLQDSTGGDQPALLVDDVRLTEDTTPPATVAVAVDPDLDRRPVSTFLFGVNFATPAQIADVGYTVNRWGGNRTTRYNWQLDVDNSAADWFFANYTAGDPAPPSLPEGSAAESFVLDTRGAGAEVVLTLPTMGRVAGPDRVRRWGFSQTTYGPQLLDECHYFGSNPGDWPGWCEMDMGNGLCDAGENITGYCVGGEIVGNDPADSTIVVGTSFLSDWASFMVSRAGSSNAGGVKYWALDNEPMLWDSTHRDVHPAPATYDEVWTKGRDVALAVKTVDPGVRILGPDTWGWCDLFASAADHSGDCTDGPDRQAHGGTPFVQWYAAQICAEETANGVRPVDLIDVHFYPQASGVAGLGNEVNEAVAATRLRALRELWDPAFVSESWIGQAPFLIPRLRGWVDAECPGLGIALTEYKWGGDDSPSGALAQAELLAILAREGVELATRWVVPETGTKVEEAFRLWLDYDGAGSKVTGEIVQATTSDVDGVGAYAVRSPGDGLFLFLFNKDDVERDVDVTFASTVVGPAELWRFTDVSALAAAGSIAIAGDAFSTTLPARSATLARLALDSDRIFRDGFESGSTWSWSATIP